MQDIVKWLSDNKEWVFSGIGVFAISAVISLIIWFWNKEKKPENNQTQTGGDGSINIQVGHDFNINDKGGQNVRKKDSKKRE